MDPRSLSSASMLEDADAVASSSKEERGRDDVFLFFPPAAPARHLFRVTEAARGETRWDVLDLPGRKTGAEADTRVDMSREASRGFAVRLTNG